MHFSKLATALLLPLLAVAQASSAEGTTTLTSTATLTRTVTLSQFVATAISTLGSNSTSSAAPSVGTVSAAASPTGPASKIASPTPTVPSNFIGAANCNGANLGAAAVVAVVVAALL